MSWNTISRTGILHTVSGDFVSTSRSYSWGHSQSETSYENKYDSERLWTHGRWNSRRLETQNTITDVLPAWQITWISNSLTEGLGMVVCRTGHCGHRTSLPKTSIEEHGVREWNKQTRGITSRNFRCCKAYEWVSNLVAPLPLKIGPSS